MRYGRNLIAGMLTMVILVIGICIPVCATEPEEETAVKKAEREAAEIPIQSNMTKGWPQGPATHGEAAIVMEAGTGAILYAKNIDEQKYPASITKLLTTLVALEYGVMADPVQVSRDSVSFLEPGDASIGLKEGNAINLEQALYATLLASANEAAYSVGENVGKNEGYDYKWFIDQMNTVCKGLGGDRSSFSNTNGLHADNHYTTARDMALIGKALIKYPDFMRIEDTYEYKIPATPTCEEHVFQQNHQMLIEGYANYYEHAIAGKTGYTDQALSTLVTMADNGDTKLICVVLKTYGVNVYPDTRGLFDYAFSNFTKTKVAGMEKSKAVDHIIEDESSEDGYVMLPESVAFEDLEMELSVEKDRPTEGVLSYSYEGYPIGSARAVLSESYEEERSVQIQEVPKESAKKADNKQLTKTIAVAAGAIVVVAGLITGYIKVVSKRKRKRRSRSWHRHYNGKK